VPTEATQPSALGLAPLALVAEEGIAIERGVTVDGGGIAVRSVSEGPYLTSTEAELVLARDVRVTDQEAVVAADTVRIDRDVQVPNLVYNDGSVVGTVTGTTTSPVTVPLDVQLPTPPLLVAGTQDVTVPRGTARALAPGDYGQLEVARDSTLRLADGEYVFGSVNIARNVKVTFTAGTYLVVVGPMALDREVTVVPAEAATPPHPPLPVAVLAVDGDAARPAADPAVRIGRDGQLDLSLLAPAGTVTVDRDTALRGSIIATRIALARDIHLTYAAQPSVAPVVVLDEPRDGATVGGQVTLRASETTGADLARVDFLVDGVVVGSVASAPFELVWDATTVADGSHVITAMAVDREGRAVSSVPAEVAVLGASDPALRLEADRANGLLSAEDYARFAVYRWFAPERVPEQYRPQVDGEVPDLTIPMMAALEGFDALDPAVQAELLALVFPEGAPELPLVPLTPEQFDIAVGTVFEADLASVEQGAAIVAEPFATDGAELGVMAMPVGDAITLDGEESEDRPLTLGRLTCGEGRYDSFIGGRLSCVYATPLGDFYFVPSSIDAHNGIDSTIDVVDSRLDPLQGGRNGVPDELDAIVEAYYQAAVTYQSLGFHEVPRLRVRIANLRAFSMPRFGVFYVDIDRPVYVTRHELFHQFQYWYTNPSGVLTGRVAADWAGGTNTTTGWWMESTAEWASHKAQDGAEWAAANSDYFKDARLRYARFLADHLGTPSAGLATYHAPTLLNSNLPGDSIGYDTQPQYGSFIFAEYLEQHFGAGIIAATWQTIDVDTKPIEAVDEVLRRDHGTSLREVLPGYHRTNYTIHRDSGQGYSYTSGDSADWRDLLSGTGGRPTRETLMVEAGGTYPGTGTLHSGGALYVDLLFPSQDPDGVTFTVDVTAVDSPEMAENLDAQLVYFDVYPRPCYPMDSREMTVDVGRAEHTTTAGPSCPMATLIVSHVDAAAATTLAGLLDPYGNRADALDVQYTITARPTTYETIVEHRGHDILHHRINAGPDLDRWLSTSDGRARLEIDMGDAVSAGRHGFILSAYSIDRRPRATDTIWINGVPVTLAHSRRAAVADGRYALAWGNNDWYSPNLSSWTIPYGLVTDGVNTFEIELRGSLLIYAAYVYSQAHYEPDPDPDPDPCPDCPVAT
jgi:hypothetical protein